jgi:hypothetical protein
VEVLAKHVINIKTREYLVFLFIGLVYNRRNIKYNIIGIFIKLRIRIKRGDLRSKRFRLSQGKYTSDI